MVWKRTYWWPSSSTIDWSVLNVNGINRQGRSWYLAKATNCVPGRFSAAPVGRTMKLTHSARPVWYLPSSMRPHSSRETLPPAKER